MLLVPMPNCSGSAKLSYSDSKFFSLHIFNKIKVVRIKLLCNLPYGFYIYIVNVKTMRKIFVAFSEKLNFKSKTNCK